VTVAYAQEIIKDDPSVRYVQCDAGKPENLFKSPVINELFGNDRKVAIGLNGVLYFMPDDDVSHSLQALYDWALEGSNLFLCDSDITELNEDGRKTIEIYEKSGQPMYLRPLDRTLELIKPWKLDDTGVMPLENWLDMESTVSDRVKGQWGSGALMGMILKK